MNIHALELTVFGLKHDGTATHGLMLCVSCDDEQHVRLLQRSKVQEMRALGRIERALICVKLRDELDYFGLVGRFNGDVHGGVSPEINDSS